jgi:monofunctional biosynthetic peptidoglycan transglycosylase
MVSFASGRWRFLRMAGALLAGVLSTYLGICTLALAAYSVIDPPVTGVQIQRRVGAWASDAAYEKQYRPVPLSRISDELEQAVVAAEDSRFYQHGGIDWKVIREVIEERREGESQRGGSTITQQLVKNLFMTTHSTYLRKALEVPLTYAAELLLSKERILELYLNVIEWGPGVYGAEAAAQHYYGQSAQTLSRYRSAALAACIPNPLARTPQAMDWYTQIILQRMNIMNGTAANASSATPSSDPAPADTAASASSPSTEPDTLAPDPAKALPPEPTDTLDAAPTTDTTTTS